MREITHSRSCDAVFGNETLLFQICNSLPAEDVAHLRLTSKSLAASLEHPRVWAKKYAPSVICWPTDDERVPGSGVIRTWLSPERLGVPGRHNRWRPVRYTKALGDYRGQPWRVETGSTRPYLTYKNADLNVRVERTARLLQQRAAANLEDWYQEFQFSVSTYQPIALQELVELHEDVISGKGPPVYPRDAIRTVAQHVLTAALVGCLGGLFVSYGLPRAMLYISIFQSVLVVFQRTTRDAVHVLWNAKEQHHRLLEDARVASEIVLQDAKIAT